MRWADIQMRGGQRQGHEGKTGTLDELFWDQQII